MIRLTAAGLVAAIAGAAIAAVAAPEVGQDARAGKQVALEVCAYCHVVAPDQPFKPEMKQATPSFAEIANQPTTNAKSLARFIGTTHWDDVTYPMTMPNPALYDEARDQVAAYILSLRTVGPPPRPRPLSPREKRIDDGEYVALQLCSYCHVVSDDRRYRPDAGPDGPSFAAVAADPTVSAKSLRRFLATTHWDATTLPMTMPQFMLTSDETDDVIAFILKDRHGR
jgi:mono/diheme cytochrome c family protein